MVFRVSGLKWLKCAHGKLATLINDVLLNPQKMPAFLTLGATYLLPKDKSNTQDPAKYRPITCLPTVYKVITSCITQRIYSHCEQNNIIAPQQKGCTRDSMGCKEQLIIDAVICNQAYLRHNNLFTAYIDYKKAFDSVPHDWLIQVLKIYKINPYIVTFLEHVMSSWHTTIHLNEANIRTDAIRIKRGIFQGDSLSPLWFCLALNPLSHHLNSTSYGYGIKSNNREALRINHLLYMDDLKLLASTRSQLEQLLKIVEEFSNDINMQFGLDKCRILNTVKGKVHQRDFELQNGMTIEAMQDRDLYKYLGMKQAARLDHRTMKEELKREFTGRVQQLLKTKLNSRNLFQAINTYACSALSYSFGIVNWSRTDIESIQRKIRTLLTKAQNHHPRSATERTTLPRYEGGRGLVDIGLQMEQQIIKLRSYFFRMAETSELHRAVCQADDSTPLCLSKEEPRVRNIQQTRAEQLQRWREKPLHGRHLNEITQDYVDTSASNYWLVSGQMFPETEGFLLAIQDQVVPTRNYLKYIARDVSVVDDNCRYGCRTTETIQHITGGCQVFSGTEYKLRHDAVAKIVHQELAIKLELIPAVKLPYYTYNPQTILENNKFKLYWDRTVLTDQTVVNNRPDIIVVDKLMKKATLVEVSVPNNNNLREKNAEKIAKYRELEGQIRRQWQMREVRTVPVIISSTGVVPKNLIANLKEIGLNEQDYKIIQKAVLLATARTVRKFLGNPQ